MDALGMSPAEMAQNRQGTTRPNPTRPLGNRSSNGRPALGAAPARPAGTAEDTEDAERRVRCLLRLLRFPGRGSVCQWATPPVANPCAPPPAVRCSYPERF